MKTQLTFLLDKELHDFVKQYAQQNHTSVTQLLTNYIFRLQKRSQGSPARSTGRQPMPKAYGAEREVLPSSTRQREATNAENL